MVSKTRSLATQTMSPKETTKLLKEVEVSSEYILAVIDQIIVEEEVNPDSKVKNTLQQVSDMLTRYLRTIAKIHGIKISQQIHAPGGMPVKTNFKNLSRTIFGLLKMRAHYCHDGEMHVDVSLQDEDKLVLKLQDSGRPLTIEEVDLMTGRFTKKSTVSKLEGPRKWLPVLEDMCSQIDGQIYTRRHASKNSSKIMLIVQDCVSKKIAG